MRLSQSVPRFVIAIGLISVAVSPVRPAIAENSTPYPAEAVEGFTKSCTSQGSSKGVPAELMKEICSCSIDSFQQAYTFEQFAKIDSDLGAGKPAPAEMNEMVQACVLAATKK